MVGLKQDLLMLNEHNYLTDMPQNCEEYGFCKVLLVRKEIIHIKHIMTELFVRKTVDIYKILQELNMLPFDYMEYLTNRIRRIHKISRSFSYDVNEVVKQDGKHFFPLVQMLNQEGLKCCIVLDFDGVVSKRGFAELYKLCLERCKTVICSANPTVNESTFDKLGLALPSKIYANKGKQKKLSCLKRLQETHDFIFYVDDEDKYLEVAWCLGIHTFKFAQNKVVPFSLNSK